jgi:RNA polymerase sigma-B factor
LDRRVLVARQEEKRLFLAYHRTGGHAERDALVERFLPLARSLARRYRRGSEPLEDLEQVASLALVKAVDGFDPARDTAFSSYAVPSIVGAIKRHFRDCGWSIHVPRDLQELAMRVERVSEQLAGPAGEAPTAAAIAAHAGVGVEDVLEAREAYRALRSVSLDQPRGTEADGAETLMDTLDSGDSEIPRAFDRVAVDALLARLEPREQLIVRLYYHEDMTQAEIGDRLGYSQMHVSRLLRQAVSQLAAAASDDEPLRLPHGGRRSAARRSRTAASLPPSVQHVRGAALPA